MTYYQKICGIINHGTCQKELHFIPENFAHNASLQISILHDHIVRSLKATKIRPEVIQIQADNSGKDNKNRYLFGYCAVSHDNIHFCKTNTKNPSSIIYAY